MSFCAAAPSTPVSIVRPATQRRIVWVNAMSPVKTSVNMRIKA